MQKSKLCPEGITGGVWKGPLRILNPPPPKLQLPDEQVKKLYPVYRWRILESTFIGYAGFYLVRNNLSPVAKELGEALSYSHSMLGTIMGITAIAYGLGKFFMGSLSDRSDARKFMAAGLFLTAICNFAFGAVNDFSMHLALWALNGFIQGMGWAPCGRSMGHWFSVNERGVVFSIWNTSHNIGGGIAGILSAYVASSMGWQYAFYIPGVIAIIGAFYLLMRLKDTPQSCGLPSIEEYRSDYTEYEKQHGTMECELTTRELFGRYIIKNKYVWLLAIANLFAYIVRYSMLDWGPTYIREAKGGSLSDGGWAVFISNFGGIPSTIFLGWISDKLGGRRGMVSFLCMVPICLSIIGLIFNPVGNLVLDMIFLGIIGMFIYPVINLFVIMALDFTSKKAIGTAAGLIGLFGYIGRASQAQGFGYIVDHYSEIYSKTIAWNIVLGITLASAIMCMIVLGSVWNLKPKT